MKRRTNQTIDPLTLLDLDPDWIEAEAYPEGIWGEGWIQGLVALVFG